jgi:uncharacterized protein (TIGR02996 family)
MDDAERQHLTDLAHDLASDAPRLAYADWLLARGRAYGEFVRKSIACAKLSEAKQAAASKALDALLKAHGKDGLGAAWSRTRRKHASAGEALTSASAPSPAAPAGAAAYRRKPPSARHQRHPLHAVVGPRPIIPVQLRT